MTLEELMALPDVTPTISYVGDKIKTPIMDRPAKVLFTGPDDGLFTDPDGVMWITGLADGQRVRQRY